MPNNESTMTWKVDIQQLKAEMQEAKRSISLANSEFNKATAGMDKWQNSITGVEAKLKQLNAVSDSQNKILASLKKEYELVCKEQGETSKRAQELAIQINNQEAACKKTEKEIKDFSGKLDELKRAQTDSRSAAEKLTDTISEQEDELSKLKKEYASAVLVYGENSKEAKALAKQIETLSGELNENKGKMDAAEKAADELADSTEKAGDAAEKSESKFGKLAKTLAAGLAAGMAAVATAAVAAGKKLWDLSGEVAALGDEIDKNSQKVGLSNEAYQKWDYAMKISGTEMASCTTGLKTLTNTFDDAINGSASAAEKFERLGLKLEDIRDMSREDLFATVVTALQNVSSETEKAALANDVFGKSGQDLLPLLNLTEEQLGELMNEAEEYGMVMSDDAVASSAAFQDSLTKLRGTMAGARNSMIGTLLPGLTSIVNGFAGLVAGVEGSDESLKKGFANVIKNVKAIIPQAVKLLASLASAFLEAAPDIVQALAEGIFVALPGLLATVQSLIPSLTSTLLGMLPILIQAGCQIILTLIQGAALMLPQAVSQIVSLIPMAVQALVSAIPELLQGAISFFMAIVDAIPIVLQSLLEALPTIIETVLGSISEWLPMLIDGAISLLMSIVDAIPVIIPMLIEALPTIISTILNCLVEALPVILDGAITLFMALIEALPVVILALVDELPRLVETIVSILLDNLPVLLRGAITLFMALVQAIPEIVLQLVKSLPQIITAFVNGLIGPLKGLFTGLWDGIKNLAKGALDGIKNLWSTVSGWFKEKIIDPIKNFFSGMWDGLKNGAKQAWEGVKSVFGGIADWFKNVFKNAWQKVKDVFSAGGKVFEGIKDGIVNAFKTVVNAIIRGINKVIAVPFNAINAVFRKLKDISILGIKPFGWLNEFGVPQIPELRRGGVLKRGQVGLLEGDGAEAVVPLERNREWIARVAQEMVRQLDMTTMKSVVSGAAASMGGGEQTFVFNQYNNSPKALDRKTIYRESKSLLFSAKARLRKNV